MNSGAVGILNVGAGDTKLSFDKSNPQERIRAARIVKDMLRRGYALLIEVDDGKGGKTTRRALDFDEAVCEYIIADLDPVEAERADKAEAERGQSGKTEKVSTDDAPGEGAGDGGGRRRGRPVRVPAERARAVAVGRTAGG